MDKKYSEYLDLLLRANFEFFKKEFKLKNYQEFKKFCNKKNVGFKIDDFKIEENHEIPEYFDKYLKSIEKEKAGVYTANQLFIMDKKSKYWKIPNETDLFYFETPSFHRRHPVLLILLFGAVAAGGIVGGVIPLINSPTQTLHKVEITDDEHTSFVIEGGQSLTNHKPGDVIEITFSVDGATEPDYKYGLPLDIGEGLRVDNAADAKYEFDEETGKGKLIVTFGEKDIDINLTALKYCVSEDIKCILPINPEGEEQELMSFGEFRTFVSENLSPDPEYPTYASYSCADWTF